MESHIGQHISQATEMQTLCWSKTRPSFSGADNSYISWPINTIFVPRIGMYIRINIQKMDFIYLKIWCNSVIFCQRGHFFWLTLYWSWCTYMVLIDREMHEPWAPENEGLVLLQHKVANQYNFCTESACTSGLIWRKRISFISRFGTIVSYFVGGDIFIDSPCIVNMEIVNKLLTYLLLDDVIMAVPVMQSLHRTYTIHSGINDLTNNTRIKK